MLQSPIGFVFKFTRWLNLDSDVKHLCTEFGVDVVALLLNNATASYGRLETVCVEVVKVDIFYGSPVRKKKFHRSGSYLLYCLEVSHVGFLVVYNKVIEQEAI